MLAKVSLKCLFQLSISKFQYYILAIYTILLARKKGSVFLYDNNSFYIGFLLVYDKKWYVDPFCWMLCVFCVVSVQWPRLVSN